MKWREYRNRILSTIDAESFFVDEFTKSSLMFHRHGNELKGQCFFTDRHVSGQDSNPSFTVNLGSGAYLCNACGAKGNIHTFYMLTRGLDRQDAWYALGDALGIERPVDADSRPGIDPGLPTIYHKNLLSLKGVDRDVLTDKRGLTEATLSRFQIGWDNERVTIPIYDEYNELVNIRRYKWDSYEDSSKMTSYVDEMSNTYGEDRIYGIENLFNENITEVVWCEGEWDRLIAEQLGLPACSSTAGADNFRTEWFKLIKKKKRIYVCYDNDDAGRRATEYIVDNLRSSMEVWVVNWPKDWRKKGDITDIVVKDGYTKEMFVSLFTPVSASEDVPIVSLAISSNAKYAGKRIKVPVLVAGKDNAPFVYPKTVRAHCSEGSEDKKAV